MTRITSRSEFPSCADCNIRHRAVCATCDTDELRRLEEIKYYRSFDAGQQIMFEGDEMVFVGSVVTGAAKLSRTLPDGRIQMLGLLLPSDFIGRPGREQVGYDVEAIQKVTLCCFRRKPFETLVEATPHIGQRLLMMSLDELEVAREWMVLLGRKTAREKITCLLALIARRTASLQLRPLKDSLSFEMPMSRETMGEYLGLTIETVSRQMTALRKDGLIKMEGSRTITIPDLASLMAETGDDTSAARLS
ncbi:helix-turn-helix domain-containing protein [Sulfitobacter sp. F26204]|uniref:transcriptional regulator FnrL n=1 Tax=Sulfitobacter sp. F26204 TaxID=2996014 RepID=UPI00225DE601|nr:helix-turn-helix domain-containing protein [Sulfitobacter sp. F26204]MCX7560152.1 helix-turn-helix domain-containing protein [Sulfitobacter sp. F26204]